MVKKEDDMLGTSINKDLYKLINKSVILNDPKEGPIKCEVKDITNGMVIYEAFSGELCSIKVEEFEKIMQED